MLAEVGRAGGGGGGRRRGGRGGVVGGGRGAAARWAAGAGSPLVLLDIDGSVAIVSNNRPEVHNAASDAFNRRLWEVFYELHLRDDIRCVVWRGNGKSFSSGRDLRELGGRAMAV